jgi:hypothetical protein
MTPDDLRKYAAVMREFGVTEYRNTNGDVIVMGVLHAQVAEPHVSTGGEWPPSSIDDLRRATLPSRDEE